MENEETFEALSARPKALLDSFQQRFLFARLRRRTKRSSMNAVCRAAFDCRSLASAGPCCCGLTRLSRA
ncbi:hypothetical protein C6946_02695 [Burkholderia thailandensis]|nr:hypothetical protein C6946_02695 [Burkholderia thailandensis]